MRFLHDYRIALLFYVQIATIVCLSSSVDDGSNDSAVNRKVKQMFGFVPRHHPYYSASQLTFPVPVIPALGVPNSANNPSESSHV